MNHATETTGNKVALITGAARRIGAEIARYLHQHDMNVIIHYKNSYSAADTLCKALNAKRADSACLLAADLAQIAAIPMMVEQAVAHWGRLDVVVNNASQFLPSQFSQITPAQWDECFNPNLKAPYFLIQAALPSLRKHNGVIINIGDIRVSKPLMDYSLYCMSKAGLAMMTKSLAKELGPQIRVNAIDPGSIIWPEGENELDESAKQKIIEQTALKRQGDPSNIAHAVLFLINNEYITGHMLIVDGGRLLN